MHLTTAPAAATKSPTPALIEPREDRNWWIFLAVCLLLGATLRLVFPSDIEYKADERYSMSAVEQFRQSGAIPAVGMPSSTGVVNAGPSVWIFLLLGSMSGASNPAELARSVAVLNILALAILAAIAIRVVPPEQREIWGWTAALFCVNVFAVLFARKIWPQCVEPFFTALLILAWFHRSRRAAAFCWGVLEALLGQFHMAGFFFAAALLLWTLAFDRRRERGLGMQWKYAVTGMCLGAVPMIPWLAHGLHSSARQAWTQLLGLPFWFAWLRTPLGLGLDYNLGWQYKEFPSWPKIGSHATYAVFACMAITVGTVAVMGAVLLRRRKNDKISWADLVGLGSETTFLEAAGLWGAGLLLSAAAVRIYPHYLIAMFPLPWIWVARLGTATGRGGRLGLAAIWLCQLLLSACFLYYIHVHHGAWWGDFGVSYGYQINNGLPR